MDKYEYKLKIDQMKALIAEKDYLSAAEIADSINWRKVRNVNLLMKAGEVYINQKRYEDARDILLIAYDRSPIGRLIIYRLAEIAIKMKNFEEAEEYYDEFVEIAPHDNLKYILRYKLNKAKGADIKLQIAILEEFKEAEYTEEWAYQLAYLYHQAGEGEKCVDACDELILWFGEGIYVERALELKMLYQPLTKSQEDKYRAFKQQKSGIRDDNSVRIPVVSESVEKFNTANLQEELAKSMQQIMDAAEKETVDDAMDNIKKMVEEIPYLQMARHEEKPEDVSRIKADQKINESLRDNFKEILAEDQDGQLQIPAQDQAKEPQAGGQMSIEDVLSEWEKTRRAAKAALELAQRQKLESAKARALQEAGEIMERLADMIPKLDAGITPTQIMKEEYLQEDDITSEERAGRYMADMNQMLQKQIEKLKEEVGEGAKKKEKEPDLLRKIKRARPNFDEQIGLKAYIPKQLMEREPASPSGTGILGAAQEEEAPAFGILPQPEEKAAGIPDEAAGMAEYPQALEEPSRNTKELSGAAQAMPPEEDWDDCEAERGQEEEAQERLADLPEETLEADARQPQEAPRQPVSQPEEPLQQPVSQPEEPLQQPVSQPEEPLQQPVSQPEEPLQQPVSQPEEFLRQESGPFSTELSEEEDEALLEEMRLAEAEFYGTFRKKADVTADEPVAKQQPKPEDLGSSAILRRDTKEIPFQGTADAVGRQASKKAAFSTAKPMAGQKKAVKAKLTEEQKAMFSYFIPVDGMESQILRALTQISAKYAQGEDSKAGHLLIQGGQGCGKTILATQFIKALQKEEKHPNGKVGKIDAKALNKKDLSILLKKIAGGCLIIEQAGEISKETAVKLSLLLEQDKSGILVIMEDTRKGLECALGQDEGFSRKFSEKIVIPVFTSDELVEFGKAYAHDLDYEIDNMGVLALYNRISNIQRVDHATNLTEVKEIVDEAIENAEKKTLKRAFSIITSRRYTEDDYVILREKDFEG